MIKILNLFIILLLFACTHNQEVFWCGDHACVNKKEKERYFEENMIVEIKSSNSKEQNQSSDINEIIQQGNLLKKDSKSKKLTRKERKEKIKEEKKLAKLLLKQKKQRIKDEKEIAKKIRKEELLNIKNQKKLANKLKKEEKNNKRKKIDKKDNMSIQKTVSSKNNNFKKFSNFKDIVKLIAEKSKSKPFPDINGDID